MPKPWLKMKNSPVKDETAYQKNLIYSNIRNSTGMGMQKKRDSVAMARETLNMSEFLRDNEARSVSVAMRNRANQIKSS